MDRIQNLGAQLLIKNILKAAVAGEQIKLTEDQKKIVEKVIKIMNK